MNKMDCLCIKTVMEENTKGENTKIKQKLCLQRSDLGMDLLQGTQLKIGTF